MVVAMALWSGTAPRVCVVSASGFFPRACCTGKSLANLVVVTRERGKNEKLMNALRGHGIGCLELPLVEHTPGPDLLKLALTLREKSFQWVVVTSPEAAAVFMDGWKNAGSPRVRVAAVGEGTKQALKGDQVNGLLDVGFVPSQANACALAEELPHLDPTLEVLYPASLKASNELAKGLEQRGFRVCRLNTYSTESVKNLQQCDIEQALEADVVTFASPTAVRAWTELVLSTHTWKGAAACIGGTSAAAARKAGIENIYYPENPGLEGWVESVLDALKSN